MRMSRAAKVALAAFVASGCGRINFDAINAGCELPAIEATGTEYFIGPAGSDAASGSSAATAWATFAHAWTIVQPGDTLTLLDGVYRQPLSPTISGAPGVPILIRAQHNGGAIIDGEAIHEACAFQGTPTLIRDFDVVGIHCTNSSSSQAPFVISSAERIRVRRVTAYGIYIAVFDVSSSNDVVLEDVAAYGGGDNMYKFKSCQRPVLRRAYARWTTAGPQGYQTGVYLEDSTDGLVENCVVTAVDSPDNYLTAYDVHTVNVAADRNRFLANVAYGPLETAVLVSWTAPGGTLRPNGTVIRDHVTIANVNGVFLRADAMVSAEHLTLVAAASAFPITPNQMATQPIGFSLTNSVLSQGDMGIAYAADPIIVLTDHHDNVFDRMSTPYVSAAIAGENEPMLSIDWPTATYGNGAYLMRPPPLATAGSGGGPVGAEILYRTIDGELTTTPLWPWPLEDRIRNETGMSVTWEANGGLWHTLPPLPCP